MRSLLILATLLVLAATRAGSSPVRAPLPPADPVADASAVIQHGPIRLTVLAANFVRVELGAVDAAGNASFDDRATFRVVNRRLPVPSFTVATLNETAITVSTSVLVVTLNADGSNNRSCTAAPSPDTDAVSPQRSPTYPSGTTSVTADACCALCAGDPYCTAWVWGPPNECWPLISSAGTTHAANRTFGVVDTVVVAAEVAYTTPSGDAATWRPGVATNDALQLNGTYSALDCYSTPMECAAEYYGRMEAGLLSQSGYTELADAGIARFVDAPALPAGLPTWWSLQQTDLVDSYFMAYADLNYRGALASWASVLGAPALLPRSAFGVWWSRYWPYTQDSIVSEVLQGYANYSIPLNNLVFDMDWCARHCIFANRLQVVSRVHATLPPPLPPPPSTRHMEPTDKTCESWGNWDVNTTKFPDIVTFAQQLHEHGNVTGSPLKLSVNVHPQTGIDHCDSRYPAFARANGVDPATNKTIPCDFGNQTFMDTLMTLYMDAAPLHLVDIWWTDYGGCGLSGGNQQLWNNLVMHQHAELGRGVRGQAFSRYGGLGNHRYPHGFSGDTFQHEVSLYWQVKTTQTAANVLWGFWSHDVGGFHDGQGAPGDHDPTNSTGAELLLRWIQWGAVAPVLRTHCDHCERRIWLFPYFAQMRDSMRLRNALTPYLYTEARAFFDTGVAPIHPLYYDAPKDPQVYTTLVVEREFMFGDAVLASPITTMIGNATLGATIAWSTYLPASAPAWSTWNGTEVHSAPTTVTAAYGLGDIPLFVRAGALLPLKTLADIAGDFPALLVWTLFPGAPVGAYTLYEDVGDGLAYKSGEFVATAAAAADSPARVTLTVSAAVAEGALPAGFPQERAHALQVRGATSRGTPQTVTVNGASVPEGAGVPGWVIVADADHTLAAPAGSLVVTAAPTSAWTDTVIDVQW